MTNFSHSENILAIFVTFDVSKLDKFSDSNTLVPSNIETILVTCDVERAAKFTDFNELQFWNISPISVTSAVFNSPKLIDSNLDNPLNKDFIFSSLSGLKLEKSNDEMLSF